MDSMRDILKKVLDRDGWVCKMPRCLAAELGLPGGRRISPGLHPNHIWAPSADHVIPRSEGGPGRMDNLRAAHRKCNSIASGKSEYEKMHRGQAWRLANMEAQWQVAVRAGRWADMDRGPWGGLILADPADVLGGRDLMRGPWGGIIVQDPAA